MSKSLIGHLAQNFSSHPENLATEALAFILNRSPVAAEALIRLFSTTGATIPPDLRFHTQVADNDFAIPDLVGISKANEQVIVCEAKFWAGLTDNQPVTYLKRGPRLLIFIAPAIRIPTLWPELLTRCKTAKLDVHSIKQFSQEFIVSQIATAQFLAITSWRVTLNCLVEALSSHGDQNSASDVRQLQGLCDQMDAEAFLPLRSEELSPSIPRRLLQFNQLVDSLTDQLVADGIASTTGFRATPNYGGYARYMRVGEFGWALQVETRYWATLRETPIWLSVRHAPASGKWSYSQKARERLSQLEHEIPPRLIRERDDLLIPLEIPLQVELGTVVKGVLKQLFAIHALLKSDADKKLAMTEFDPKSSTTEV